MAFLIAAWQFIRGSRNAQVGLALVVGALAFSLWLWTHDNAVRKADRAALDAKAVEKAQEAAEKADTAQDIREGAFNASQAELRNSVSADDYLTRLRSQQCAANPARCP